MDCGPTQVIKRYFWIFVGSFVYALAFDAFFVPNGIAFGGLTGLAQIVSFFWPKATVGTLVIVFNIPLFLAGWRLLGRRMLLGSLAGTALSSVLIDLMRRVWVFPPMEDKLLACVVGGAVLGVGLGILFLQGATTGGSEIVARLLKLKFAWLPMGKLLLCADLVVVALVAAVFRSLNTAFYSMVALYLSTFVMDKALYGLDNAKVACIVSDNPNAIVRGVTEGLHRSVTFLKGQGGYLGQEKKVILCAFKQKEIVSLKETVQTADPGAFMIVISTHEVLGKGFREYSGEW